jgi:hypothetical protein
MYKMKYDAFENKGGFRKVLLNNFQCIKEIVYLTKHDNTSENKFWVWYCTVKISLSYHWLVDSNLKPLQVVSLKNSF